jgi:deoxyribodipyrimidine photo-lyase
MRKYLVTNLSQFYNLNPSLAIRGGRSNALKMTLRNMKAFKDYHKERDFPALQKTTRMSPHLKFGTVSIREMYWAIRDTLGKDHGLIRELVFRDFYLKIYALRPELQRGVALLDTFDKQVPWKYDKRLFEAWKQGRTGYPMVDAAMQELNVTGHQHNRMRMLCSSVLTKYFLIDWRWGLKYYYTQLVDADVFSNTAGWGFSSSTGADAVPYFRAPFNPFIQSQKFDPDAQYIKRWIPALADVATKDIHKWFDPAIRAKYPADIGYPAPVMDHKEASNRAMQVFKDAAASAASAAKK